MQPNNARIIICIPAYNEAKSVGDIIQKAKNYATEVMVYDDGSLDNTNYVAKAAGATVIRQSTNKGYGAAIKSTCFKLRGKKMLILWSHWMQTVNIMPTKYTIL